PISAELDVFGRLLKGLMDSLKSDGAAAPIWVSFLCFGEVGALDVFQGIGRGQSEHNHALRPRSWYREFVHGRHSCVPASSHSGTRFSQRSTRRRSRDPAAQICHVAATRATGRPPRSTGLAATQKVQWWPACKRRRLAPEQ